MMTLHAGDPTVHTPSRHVPGAVPTPVYRTRRWRALTVATVVLVLLVEVMLGWQSLISALSQLRTPHAGDLAAAVAAEMASMRAYAQMQRQLLRSAGVRVALTRHVALAYAAHSLSVTLPGGPAFSTRFNYQQLRRFGASSAVAWWCIVLSGLFSAGGLALIGIVSGAAGHQATNPVSLIGYGTTGVVAAVAVRHLFRHPQTLHRLTTASLRAVNRLRRRAAERDRARVLAFLEQLRVVPLTPKRAVAAMLYAIANWAFDVTCLWLCGQAVGAGGTAMVTLLLTYSAAMTAGSLPVVPGGLGVIDSALILGLATGGSSTAGAIATVVLYRVVSLGFIVGAGWITWLVIRRPTGTGHHLAGE